jgi:hypothetical protein
VDGRAVRSATVVFSGRDAFARSRRQETLEVEDVPVGRRQVTVAVSPDQRMQADRVEGAAELMVGEGVNRAVVQVRYLARGAREVRFR